MQRKLHLLDSFEARGTDGATYKVRGYEHLVRDDASPELEAWESTGQVEYRLDDGERVELDREGHLRIARSGVELAPV